jgi:Domain of unknown function (DUF2804), C-terminal
MPSHQRARPLKAWRYVGIYGPQLMVCAAVVRIGRARQSFWAIWDRAAGTLRERTALGTGAARIETGRLRIPGRADVRLEEVDGVETVCPAGLSYAWTRKQGGIRATGTVLGVEVDARAVIDDTAAYYPRHTSWEWCAGVGRARDGRPVAWNLVSGVNDPQLNSERTVWLDGEPREVPPVRFGAGLELGFHQEAVRAREDNLVVVRSRYRQPFGTFSGVLPDGTELAEGYGVMEVHDAVW